MTGEPWMAMARQLRGARVASGAELPLSEMPPAGVRRVKKGTLPDSLQSPWAATKMFVCCVHARTWSSHSLPYVLPSVPHTG